MKLMRSLNDMLTELNYSSCRSNQASQLIILVMSFGMTIIKLILGLQSTYLDEIVRLLFSRQDRIYCTRCTFGPITNKLGDIYMTFWMTFQMTFQLSATIATWDQLQCWQTQTYHQRWKLFLNNFTIYHIYKIF